MARFHFMKDGVPADFESPTGLPVADEQARSWQARNKDWWEHHPMRYDWKEEPPLPSEDAPAEAYQEVDARFFRRANTSFGFRSKPFDCFIDFPALKHQSVLEIGVGCGSHAQLLSGHAGRYVGVDLTEYAVKTTTNRLHRFEQPGTILQMDAEHLKFPDASFDFVWSWGVIHHSSNTRRILEEIHRVLRPGGMATIMVYHRSPWNSFFRGALFYGVLKGGFLRTRSVHRLLQETTDGALARYYTVEEWQKLVGDLFAVRQIGVYGHKEQLIPLPYGRAKRLAATLISSRLGRLITNRPAIGFLLVSTLQRPLA